MPSSPSQNSDEHHGLRRILAPVFFFFLGVLFSRRRAPHSESVDPDNTQDSTDDDGERRQCISESPIRVVVESIPPAPAPPKQRDPNREKDRRLQRWMLAVNIATFLAVAWYASIAGQQRDRMIDANKISHDSVIAVQRAFITTEGTRANRFQNETPDGKRWAFEEYLVNNGTTPATQVIHLFASDELGKGIESLDENSFIGNEKDIANSKNNIGTVGPKGPYIIGPIFRTDEEVLNSKFSVDWKRAGTIPGVVIQKKLFFWGWVIYKDVFPDTKPHLVEFCQQLSGVLANTKEKSLQLVFGNCPGHNCTDEYCKDYEQIISTVKP